MKNSILFGAVVVLAGSLVFAFSTHDSSKLCPQCQAMHNQLKPHVEPAPDDADEFAVVSDEDVTPTIAHQAKIERGIIRLLRAETRAPQTLEPNLPDRPLSPPGYDSNPSPVDSLHGQEAMRVLRQAITAYETKLSVIANNLANADTIGFKQTCVTFEQFGVRNQKLPGSLDACGGYTPTGVAVGLGTRVQSTQTDFSQGVFRQTNRELDVAIEGKGFFQVNDPDTGLIMYSRAGNFSLNFQGQLVIGSAQTGRQVNPSINFPSDATSTLISPNGTVQYSQANSPNMNTAGQLQIAMFINSEGLQKMGENLFRQTDSSGLPQIGTPGQNGFGVLRQGALEQSNVNVSEALREWTQTLDRLKTFDALLLDE